MLPLSSRARRAAVGQARLRPLPTLVGAGIFGRQLLVDVDAQARLVVGIHVAVAHFRAAGEHLVDEFGEAAPLLDAEVGRPQVEVQVGGVADRRDVAGPCQAVRMP